MISKISKLKTALGSALFIATLAWFGFTYTPHAWGDSTLSQLPAAGVLGSNDIFYCVQSGISSRCTAQQIATFVTGTVPPIAGVVSFNNRSGIVQSTNGDYNFNQLAGNISTLQMASGTNASNTTFFRGDGTWSTPTASLSPGGVRVTTDQAISNTTLTTVLSVTLATGSTYAFDVELSFTDAAAGGIQVAMNGTATVTSIIYDGWIVDSGANGIKGNTQATSLGTVVASSTTGGTAGHVTIHGTIAVNAGGTLTVQAAQNTTNGTATTIKAGSRIFAYVIP